MKLLAVSILILTLAVGAFMNGMKKDGPAQAVIEDSVESSLAAPLRPDLPL